MYTDCINTWYMYMSIFNEQAQEFGINNGIVETKVRWFLPTVSAPR